MNYQIEVKRKDTDWFTVPRVFQSIDEAADGVKRLLQMHPDEEALELKVKKA